MPVLVQEELFEILPSPSWGTPQIRKDPKVVFESSGGYRHQRDKWTSARWAFPLKWALLTEAEVQTLTNWLDNIGSDTFLFVPPTAAWGGVLNAVVRLCRLPEQEVRIIPLAYGFYSAEIIVEDV